MTDANGLTALDADFYRPDAVTWVLRDRIDTMRIYQKIAGRDVLPVYVSSTMDCGALEYRVWVEKIEGRAYQDVCKMFAKGVQA